MEVNLLKMVKLDTLRHRDTAKKVVESVLGVPVDEEVVIDFSGIVFASRSFCHELLRGLEGMKVTFRRMAPEVDEMMQLAHMKPRVEPRNMFSYKKLEPVSG